ncbi:MAG: hypothetical protein KGI80_05270 [Verrucomicrobiota bacterium]|nr:hypothetical protein [Verrucomicrobiota bacterium]
MYTEKKLTTEALRKKFKNNFNLCNFSIHVGQEMLRREGGVMLHDILKKVEERVDER